MVGSRVIVALAKESLLEFLIKTFTPPENPPQGELLFDIYKTNIPLRENLRGRRYQFFLYRTQHAQYLFVPEPVQVDCVRPA
jgi:hypothetical protein